MTIAFSPYKLVVMRGGIRGREFILKEGLNLSGRWDPESGAFPEVDLTNEDTDGKVSRKHVVFDVNKDQVTLEDQGSLNGTYVNRGPKLNAGVKCRLRVGDEIVIGKVFLILEKST